MWLAVWPGVATASMVQPAPRTTSPSASARSGRKSVSLLASSPRRLADIERSRRAMRAFRQHGRAGRRLDARHRRRMIAMGVGDEDMRDGLAAHRVEQRRDMGLVERAGIDDGDTAAPDDVAHRALEGERAWIVGRAAGARRARPPRPCRGRDRRSGRTGCRRSWEEEQVNATCPGRVERALLRERNETRDLGKRDIGAARCVAPGSRLSRATACSAGTQEQAAAA